MAIYHLTTRVFSRAQGAHAKAKYDYIAREGRYQRDAGEVSYRESGNLPTWATTAREFWSAADIYERSNAQLGREVEVALPRELSPHRQRQLAREFASELVGTRHPYTLAIHKGNGSNPHAHLIFSPRTLDTHARPQAQFFKRANRAQPALGGAPKDTSIQKRVWLETTRERWAVLANRHLKLERSPERIDHRSLAKQGMTRVPTRHLGPKSVGLIERTGSSRRAEELLEEHKQTRSVYRMMEQVQLELERLERSRSRERERDAPSR